MQDIVHIEISSAMWTSVLSRHSVSNRYGLWRNAITHYTMTFHNHGNQLLAVSPSTALPPQKHLSSQQLRVPNFLAVNLQLTLIPMPTQITHGSLTCCSTILFILENTPYTRSSDTICHIWEFKQHCLLQWCTSSVNAHLNTIIVTSVPYG